MATRQDKVEVYRRADGLYDWRRKSGYNGKVTATSGGQGYARRGNAVRYATRSNPGCRIVEV